MSGDSGSLRGDAQGEIAAAALRTTQAVRARSGQLLARARAGQSDWFTVDDSRLDACAQAVADATRSRYPDLRIPVHSRWRHFEAGGVDRRARLDALLGDMPPPARAKAMIDLVVVSVLLDAGAGPDWRYTETESGQSFTRSEGLGVASFHAFTAGLFSSDPAHPLQADLRGLRALDTQRLAQAFQVGDANPLVGLDGRATLLRRLGEALQAAPAVFGADGRPGALFDVLTQGSGVAHTPGVAAHDILALLLGTLSGIWPMGSRLHGVPLGDAWPHPAVQVDGPSNGWVPFHKLSQWLTYSLLEPFAWAGVTVHGVDALTGLPEYRNGGLLIDSGVLRLRDPQAAQATWQPGDALIVEWRACTVALMDEVAPRVRTLLGLTEDQLTLAQVLEGGTWAAGRAMAQRLRGGLPPLNVASDGTVF